MLVKAKNLIVLGEPSIVATGRRDCLTPTALAVTSLVYVLELYNVLFIRSLAPEMGRMKRLKSITALVRPKETIERPCKRKNMTYL